MGRNSRRIKERAMEIEENGDYQNARDEAFESEFIEMFTSDIKNSTPKTKMLTGITEDDVQGFMDSFTFPEEDEWCMDKACSEADEWADSKMEEERDRKMGL